MSISRVQGQEPSSSASRISRYDVFLSFRGEDTRRTFVGHLYAALVDYGFRTFRDDDEIERGESFYRELQRALKESRVSIVVLSRNYASSSWCLDMLAMILQRRRMGVSGHLILPVFYGVDPSDVRKQRGDYAEAFARHEERSHFKEGDGDANEWKKKLGGWKHALKEVADLAAMVLENQADSRCKAKFIQNIVKVVEDKLRRTNLNVAPYPVGLHSRAKSINLWLQDGEVDVGILAISGMGGIGKTTIAKFVYNLNFSNFEGSSFLANVREISRLPNGLVHLQKQLFSDIQRKRDKEICNVEEGILKIKEAVASKRVFIVLDDVDKWEQLEALGMSNSLSPGSRVIITTRHGNLQGHCKYLKVHRVEELDRHESLELFSWYAFGKKHPSDNYLADSERVVEYCEGIPMAINVLGASLCGRSLDVWKRKLQKLKAIPDKEIFEKLRLSYDSLQDDHDKSLFLDIACFFVGKDKDYTITILDGCEYHALIGIQNLVDENLLTIDTDNRLVMHPLIQEMGREIVQLESPEDLGRRSRIWNHKDSFHVLIEKTGTRNIKGLVLDMHFLKEDRSEPNICGSHKESLSKKRKWSLFDILFGFFTGNATKSSNQVVLEVDAFARMSKLQLLQINDVQLHGNYKNFPKELRWLCWSHCPLPMVPSDFPMGRLVALEMPNSCLKKLLNPAKYLVSLKLLDLSYSCNLCETPDFSMLPNLERLILENCTSLVKVSETIGHLERLVVLSLRNCRNLRMLPKTICWLKSLATLDISGCINLENIPVELGYMDSLRSLSFGDSTGYIRSDNKFDQ